MLHSEDKEFEDMARLELQDLHKRKMKLRPGWMMPSNPKIPNAGRNTIIEIRAGTGGEEAALFAGDLYRMYSRYAESKGWEWKFSLPIQPAVAGLKKSSSPSPPEAYMRLRFEGGTHRVQRVPRPKPRGAFIPLPLPLLFYPKLMKWNWISLRKKSALMYTVLPGQAAKV